MLFLTSKNMKIGIIAILSLLPFVMEAQIVVKPNLNSVVGDTTKFSSFDDGKLSIDAYNKQFGLTLKNIVTDVPSGNRYIYGIYNIQNTSTLPYQEESPGNPWVRVGIQTEMYTRQGQFINSIYNYVKEKSGTPTFQTTGILNKFDSVSNQLNGFYNSVRYSGAGDIRLVRNYIDETTQTNAFGAVYGLYNDFEMSQNKDNYGVYNVMKYNNNYAPSYATTGIKNYLKISGNANPANLVGSVRSIGIDNDIELYGNVNNYGIYNILKMTQAYQGTTFGIRSEIIPAAGVNTTTGFSPNFRFGIFSQVDSAYAGTQVTGYAGYFVGPVVVNGSFTQLSDISLKENVENYTGALSMIKNIVPKKYDLKSERGSTNRKKHLGFIAQEFETVVPDLVSDVSQPGKTRLEEKIVEVTRYEIEKDDKGNPTVKTIKTNEKQEKRIEGAMEQLKGINYTELIPMLLQAIKEQQVIIEQLQKDIDKIKVKIGN
jgi:Chaperone of endosialidase